MNRRCGQRCCISLLYVTCEMPVLSSDPACELGALGGTRTPNLLIRRLCHTRSRPAHFTVDLPKRYSLVRSRRQR
jgi:hypothetical protein